MSKKKVSIFVIILGIIFLAVGTYLMLNEIKEEDFSPTPPVAEDKYIESLNPNDDLVQSLYHMTKGYWYSDLSENNYYFYKSDVLFVSEFEVNQLFNLVFERIYKKGLLSDELTVKEDVVKEEFNEIYGNYVTYSKIEMFTNGCYHIMFDDATNEYKYFLTNGCVGLANVISEVTAAHRYENKIVIEESVLFSNGFEYFYDVELTNKSNSTIIDVNDSNILKYNYTFRYDKELDKYYFYSVEKAK